eukprot:m.66341 g.66341  ORF g.66341 m.66341 type:complete len:950 (+) comp12112_c1_seq1:280-3129(+)
MASETDALLSSAPGPDGSVNSSSDSPSVLEEGKGKQEQHKNQLGTINGCYVPCLLNIMGIILFLRLGWAVGQAGIGVTWSILCIATLQAVITVLSLSALVTNGTIASGGSYYMISRCLGPEFGGSIGLLFYAAYAMGVAFYTIGFATAVQTTFWPDVNEPEWIVRAIGSCGLFFVLAISLAGAEFFAKFNILFFVIQFGSIFVGMVSMTVPHSFTGQSTFNGTSFNVTTDFPHHFTQNWKPHFAVSPSCHGEQCEFHMLFAILFPMVTGIMEGANLSGDLKDPAKSIPKGTLWALFTSFVIYTLLIFAFGSTFPYLYLHADQNVFQNVCVGSIYIVVTGIIISSISSALGSLFGGSRVLQAMGRDNLMRILKPFAWGSKKGDEPRVAVLFTWLVAQACVMIGDIDVVAPIETSFFCLSYAMVNLACFLLSAMNAPNFRPEFRFYSWPLSLFGFVLNLGIMFYLAWEYALGTVTAMTLLFVYLSYYGPVTDWGDISNELIFHQVRKYLLKLETLKATPSKFWKPNFLVLVDNCDTGMLAFCNSLKKGGLMVVGQVLVGELTELHPLSLRLRTAWTEFFQTTKLKSFIHTTTSPQPRQAYQVLQDASGLGGMNVNTVVLPFFEISGVTTSRTAEELHPSTAQHYESLIQKLKEPESEGEIGSKSCNLPLESPREFCQVINDVLFFQKNLIVTRNFKQGIRGSKGRLYTHAWSQPFVDVWIIGAWDFQVNASAGAAPRLRFAENNSYCPVAVSDTDGNESLSMSVLDESKPICFTGLVSLLLQLGQIFSHARIGPGGRRHQRQKLRLFHVADIDTTRGSGEAEVATQHLRALCKQGRVDISDDDIKVISSLDLEQAVPDFADWVASRPASNDRVRLTDIPSGVQATILNKLIKQHSVETCQVFLPLPPPPDVDSPNTVAGAYLQVLSSMSDQLPPTAFVASGETTQFISTLL